MNQTAGDQFRDGLLGLPATLLGAALVAVLVAVIVILFLRMVKGRDKLRPLPGVKKPSAGRSKWNYVGENDE